MNIHLDQRLRHVKQNVTKGQYFGFGCFNNHVGLKCKGEKCFAKL